MANDEKDTERMAAQKSKMDVYVATEGENIIEKENDNAESKDDIEMRADPIESEPIYLHCAKDQARICVLRCRPH